MKTIFAAACILAYVSADLVDSSATDATETTTTAWCETSKPTSPTVLSSSTSGIIHYIWADGTLTTTQTDETEGAAEAAATRLLEETTEDSTEATAATKITFCAGRDLTTSDLTDDATHTFWLGGSSAAITYEKDADGVVTRKAAASGLAWMQQANEAFVVGVRATVTAGGAASLDGAGALIGTWAASNDITADTAAGDTSADLFANVSGTTVFGATPTVGAHIAAGKTGFFGVKAVDITAANFKNKYVGLATGLGGTGVGTAANGFIKKHTAKTAPVATTTLSGIAMTASAAVLAIASLF